MRGNGPLADCFSSKFLIWRDREQKGISGNENDGEQNHSTILTLFSCFIKYTGAGCTPQACKLCDCPTLRPKKELGDSDRDISRLLEGRSYRSEAKGSVKTPHCIKEKEDRIKQQSSLLWGRGEEETTI